TSRPSGEIAGDPARLSAMRSSIVGVPVASAETGAAPDVQLVPHPTRITRAMSKFRRCMAYSTAAAGRRGIRAVDYAEKRAAEYAEHAEEQGSRAADYAEYAEQHGSTGRGIRGTTRKSGPRTYAEQHGSTS